VRRHDQHAAATLAHAADAELELVNDLPEQNSTAARPCAHRNGGSSR
jgi:hypothetical protein